MRGVGYACGAGTKAHVAKHHARTRMTRLIEFVGNHPVLVSAFLAILGLLLWNLFRDAVHGVTTLAADKVVEAINHQDALLLDTRVQAEYRRGHILRAIHVTPERALEQIRHTEKDKTRRIVLCSDQPDDLKLARSLMTDEYSRVACLKGGIAAWRDAGLPLVGGD